MYLVEVNEELCTGCGACVAVCPVQILGINDDGKAAVTGNQDDCLGCRSCEVSCPTGAIKVTEL